MTYKNLLDFIQTLAPEQLNQTVSIFNCEQDEYYPAHDATFTVGDDVLDDNHPILLIK